MVKCKKYIKIIVNLIKIMVNGKTLSKSWSSAKNHQNHGQVQNIYENHGLWQNLMNQNHGQVENY